MRVDDEYEGYWAGPPEPEDIPDNVVALPGAHAIEVSEDALALAFTRKFGDSMRFDHSSRRWYQWSSTHWRRLEVPVALHYARELARELGSGKRAICKLSVAKGAEGFAQADPAHAVTADCWDRDPWLLGTPGGTLNLQTGKMHSPRPSDGITKLAGCGPSKKPPELFLKFLTDATRGDLELMIYLQRIAGYCLTGMTSEHALFFIYGPGGNGKSVFLNLLVHILGDYAVSAPMDTFTSSKFNAHPTELAMLQGARLVTASETEEGRAWAEARIKALTGGDPITARYLYKDNFTYLPQFKLVFAGNHQPKLKSPDPAIQRRFNMLPFVHRPEKPDKRLEEKLREEAPSILGWALQGCLDWQQDGLSKPQVVVLATNNYLRRQDMIAQWIEDNCRLELNNRSLFTKTTELFRDWAAYAEAAGEKSGTQGDFIEAIERHGVQYHRLPAAAGKHRGYIGIELTKSQRATGHAG